MRVIDIRDMLDGTLTVPADPRFKAKVRRLGQIIGYITAQEVGISVN
jgi:hypothetical protein